MGNEKHVKCINKVRNSIKKADPNVGWIRFLLAGDNGITGQKIEYSIKKTKKDGSTSQKTEKSFVTHNFCPFCGEKYTNE